jgi:capsule polysaccharide export protein KpsE/RkpR
MVMKMSNSKKKKVTANESRFTLVVVFICIFILAMVFSVKFTFFTESTKYFTQKLLTVTQNENASVEEVSRLIQEGANVNASSDTGSTPLMLAAQYSSNTDVLQVLIDNGASIDIQDNQGKRAIDYAEQNEAWAGTSVYDLLR